MKLFAVLVSMLVGSSAFAFENKCELTVYSANGGVDSQVVEMELRQNPRADIPGYILNVNAQGFNVFASEADGNYYGKISTASGLSSEATSKDENLSLSLVDGNQTMVVECF